MPLAAFSGAPCTRDASYSYVAAQPAVCSAASNLMKTHAGGVWTDGRSGNLVTLVKPSDVVAYNGDIYIADM